MNKRLGFSRKVRLKNEKEFREVFSRRARLTRPHIAIYVKSNECSYPRLGLSISKKNLPSAAARNRFKRLVRESFRQHQQRLAGKDIVVVGYNGVGKLTNQEVCECLEQLWNKLMGA